MCNFRILWHSVRMPHVLLISSCARYTCATLALISHLGRYWRRSCREDPSGKLNFLLQSLERWRNPPTRWWGLFGSRQVWARRTLCRASLGEHTTADSPVRFFLAWLCQVCFFSSDALIELIFSCLECEIGKVSVKTFENVPSHQGFMATWHLLASAVTFYLLFLFLQEFLRRKCFASEG